MHYQVNLLKDPGSSGPLDLLAFLNETLVPELANDGITTYGIFHGLFGIASNELYLVLNSESTLPDISNRLGSYRRVEKTDLLPTVRPTEHTPREKEGIYVFRWFRVNNSDVDEIAALSKKAWETFEAGFDTEVQCLFAEPDRTSNQGTMLLVTYYTDLNVWQDSRRPAPEAQENFKRRHALTLEATPVATRLVSTIANPVVPGGTNKF